jgi:pyruvate ferredoxin oxidoreductase alpha subunit
VETIVVERLAQFVNNGEMDASMIKVESEHSACSAAFGAQAAGVRAFSATNSQGLALMHEILHIMSGARLPTVFGISNRALSSPINIWCDHSDTMSCRDTGWIQLYCESAQEILDTTLQAFRIAEHDDVLLPTMVCFDGFILSHLYEPVYVPTKAEVKPFVGRYKPHVKLDPKKPVTIGPVGMPDSYMEFKKQEAEAMEAARKVINDIDKEFKKRYGRGYGGLVEKVNLPAKTVIIALGSVCGTIKEVIKNHKDVGLLRIRSFRPFPDEEIRRLCAGAKNICVIDRAFSFGSHGPVFTEVNAALRNCRTNITGFIAGLGGRDITPDDIENVIKNADKGGTLWLDVFGKEVTR